MPNSNINQPQATSMSSLIGNITPIMLSSALAYHGFSTSNALATTVGAGVTCSLLWKYSTGTSLANTTEAIGAAVSTAKLVYALKYDHPINYGNGPGTIRLTNT